MVVVAVVIVVGRGVVATSDWSIVYWLTSLSQQLFVYYIIKKKKDEFILNSYAFKRIIVIIIIRNVFHFKHEMQGLE